MENFTIRSIQVKNIGVFEDFNLEFKPKSSEDKAEIHILTGENGTGKTTLLLMLACSIGGIGISDTIAGRVRGVGSKVSFQVSFSNLQKTEFWLEKARFSSSNNSAFLANYNEQIDLWSYAPKDSFSFAAFAYSGYRLINQQRISGISEINENPLINALNFRSHLAQNQLLQWVANMKAYYALAIAKNNKADAEKYKAALEGIEETIGEIIGKRVEFELEENPFNVVIKVDDVSLNFDQLPDGLKSIISWIADLLMRMDRIKWVNDVSVFDRNFILFLDEIEVHLHVSWQRKILPVIQKLFKNAQIFISTHSPFVIGSVDGAWVYRLKFDGQKASVMEPLLSEDAKSYDYILSEVFNIKERFGVGVEKHLNEFYKLRDSVIKYKRQEDKKKLELLREELASQSEELSHIMEFERRQLERMM